MINFTAWSVLIAILSSNLVIVFMAVVFRSKKRLMEVGFPLLTVFCFLTLLRLLFPFELLPVSINIYWSEKVSSIVSKIFFHPYGYIGKIELSTWNVLLFIWIVVSIVLFVRWYRVNYKYNSLICREGKNITDQYQELLQKMGIKAGLLKKISIYRIPLSVSPSVTKFQGQYFIILPSDQYISLEEKDMEYVLRHEVSHIMNRDLEKKMIVEFVCIVYWWNIFCKKLKKQTEFLFELRVDSNIAGKGEQYTVEYLMCLLKVAEQSCQQDIGEGSGIAFSKNSRQLLSDRFYMLTEKDRKTNRKKAVLLLIPVIILYVLSFIFIFEIHVYGGHADKITFEATIAIERQDGTYDIYYGDLLIENTNSLEHYPLIEVYSEKELEHEN